jgi:hypothetical protein
MDEKGQPRKEDCPNGHRGRAVTLHTGDIETPFTKWIAASLPVTKECGG